MPTYANETSVSTAQSRNEIEQTLTRFGATTFMYGWDGIASMVAFEHKGIRYRMRLPMPDRKTFLYTEARRLRRSDNEVNNAYEQATRQRWRALALWIKAILAAEEAGITTLSQALQSFIVLPNGQTVGEWLAPQIEDAYRKNILPPLLPGAQENDR